MCSQRQKIRITALSMCAIYAVLCVLLFTVGAEIHWAGKITLMCGHAAFFAFPVWHAAWEFKNETGVSVFFPLCDTGKRSHKSHKKEPVTILESR